MSEKPLKTQPLPSEHWDKTLEPIIAGTNGGPINVHKLMANNPALLKAWWDFRNHSVEGGTLGKRSGELVILRVAVHMQAWYEWGSHVDRGLILIKGAIPGSKGSYIVVRDALKKTLPENVPMPAGTRDPGEVIDRNKVVDIGEVVVPSEVVDNLAEQPSSDTGLTDKD